MKKDLSVPLGMKKNKNGFSVVDVVQVLTDSTDPKQYIKKMRSRDLELSAKWGTICTLVTMQKSECILKKIYSVMNSIDAALKKQL